MTATGHNSRFSSLLTTSDHPALLHTPPLQPCIILNRCSQVSGRSGLNLRPAGGSFRNRKFPSGSRDVSFSPLSLSFNEPVIPPRLRTLQSLDNIIAQVTRSGVMSFFARKKLQSRTAYPTPIGGCLGMFSVLHPTTRRD